MLDIINFAESEFGIPVLDVEYEKYASRADILELSKNIRSHPASKTCK